MDYDATLDKLYMIKMNPYKMTQKQRLRELITVIGEHPEAVYWCKNLFATSKQLNELQQQGLSGWGITQHILKNCEIVTSNSKDLTYRYFGYVKPITPATLNQVIDAVATRIQLEQEYAMVYHNQRPEQEDELTMGELSQFTR